jgi:hypothetical protein
MKMNVSGFLAFTLLSISIMSFGLTGAVSAQDLPLSVETDYSSYTSGELIKISGTIKNPTEYEQSVTVMVVSIAGENVNIVAVAQVLPDSSGNYSTTVKAGGTMNSSGEYEVRAQYNGQKITNTFNFISDDESVNVDKAAADKAAADKAAADKAAADKAAADKAAAELVSTPEPAELVSTPEPVEVVVNCGPGTESVNGICQVVQTTTQESEEGGGCLIATAAYGSELSPQVQLLREIRDNQLMNTESGSAFMSTFNNVYYSFSPAIADMERESPIFKEIVKVGLTPMISSLAIMENANSESEVLGLGLSVIMLNIGMYIAAPALIGMKVHQQIKSRK